VYNVGVGEGWMHSWWRGRGNDRTGELQIRTGEVQNSLTVLIQY